MSENTVAKVMAELGLAARAKHRRKSTTRQNARVLGGAGPYAARIDPFPIFTSVAATQQPQMTPGRGARKPVHYWEPAALRRPCVVG